MALVLALWLAIASPLTDPSQTVTRDCIFFGANGHFKGECGALFQLNDWVPTLTLAPATTIRSGRWRDDIRPVSVWVGDMSENGGGPDPIELVVYEGDWGVLRTIYGWFPVTHFTSTPTLGFDLDASHEVGPDALDQKIVRRAATILSTAAVWNRADNRDCPASATTWSIYCAMEKATIETTGSFDHRRPALEVVRIIIDERTAGRNYNHRLMDYNNDRTTRLNDVQSLFKEALGRMSDSSWLRTHGFVCATANGTWQPC